MSEILFELNRDIFQDLMSGAANWENFADQIRQAGWSHETDAITIVIADGE